MRPPGCLFRDWKQTTKENGQPVETDEGARKKYDDAKKSWNTTAAAKREAAKKGSGVVGTEETGGAQHYMGGEVVPTFEDMISGDDDNNDVTLSYQFTSHGVIEIDLWSTNHAFNQASTSLGWYNVLNDNQYTSNINVEKDFVWNIWPCKWTLIFRTQAGECLINQIADLLGVGTVWFYLDGVANILSQNKLVIDSK